MKHTSETLHDGTIVMRGLLKVADPDVCAECKGGMVGQLVSLSDDDRQGHPYWVDEALQALNGKRVTITVIPERAE